MSDTLRSGLIRLAFHNPDLRADLLPLLTKEAAGPSYKDYVEKKRKKGEKPLDEEAWESRVKGKGEGKSEKKDEGKKDEGGGKTVSLSRAEGEKLSEALSGWARSAGDPIYTVSSHAKAGKPIPADDAKKALGTVTFVLEHAGAYQLSNSEKKQVATAKKMLEKAVKSEKPKSEKPKPKFKGNYRPKMESVMTKHDLTDDDAKQVMEFSVDRPKKGKPQSPEELKRRFMQNAKPETKERMKNMSPADFMIMLRAVLDQEEGGGKTASLRSGLIRLAYENPNMRADILPLLAGGSIKTAAGPDSTGRNWKKHTTAGINRWIWQGRPGEPIKQFMVIQKKAPPGPGSRLDNSYWMTVKLEDGSFFQSPIQKTKPTDWFNRAAQIYAASQTEMLDFSNMPEKWSRLNGPAPV